MITSPSDTMYLEIFLNSLFYMLKFVIKIKKICALEKRKFKNEALPVRSKRCRLLSQIITKLSVQSTKISS